MVVRNYGTDPFTAAYEMFDRIGEVVFLLRVIVLQLSDGLAQFRFVECVDAGVHLVDRELFRRCIPYFDDALDFVPVAHDTSEIRRQRHLHGNERHRGNRVARAERPQHAAEDLFGDERHVAVRHDDASTRIGLQRFERNFNRMPGTELFSLHDAADAKLRHLRLEFVVRDDQHVADAGTA